MTISDPVWVLWHPSTHPDLKTRMNLLHTTKAIYGWDSLYAILRRAEWG